MCDICPSRASALAMMSYSDNDKQLVQRWWSEIYRMMSDYELDRETKVLFAAYFAEYEELKRHYFGPDDDDDDDLDVALMFGVWRDLEFARALYKDDQIAKDCFVMDAIAEENS